MNDNSVNIRGARIVDPSCDRDEIGDIFVRDGFIVDSGAKADGSAREIDAKGLVAAPGWIDLHVHFREPGGETSETVASGSKAAARGGFTTVVTMPNTTPPVDSPLQVRRQAELGQAAGHVRTLQAGCITKGRQGRMLADIAGMVEAEAVAFTDDGQTVDDNELMRAAMIECARLRRPVMDHALDPAAAGQGVMHEGALARRLGLPGIPSSAESSIVQRDIALCRETGCAIHIQHVSAQESLKHIRAARREGLPVTGEATPHHLFFNENLLENGDANGKMNPPLRTEKDRQALLAAVADGALSALATDHAPHPAAAKGLSLRDAPFGVTGLETAAAATYTVCVASGLMSIMEWIRRWTEGPASILGLPAPSLAPGSPCHAVLLDLNVEFTPQPRLFASCSTNSPFIGIALRSRVVHTLFHGRTTWSAEIGYET